MFFGCCLYINNVSLSFFWYFFFLSLCLFFFFSFLSFSCFLFYISFFVYLSFLLKQSLFITFSLSFYYCLFLLLKSAERLTQSFWAMLYLGPSINIMIYILFHFPFVPLLLCVRLWIPLSLSVLIVLIPLIAFYYMSKKSWFILYNNLYNNGSRLLPLAVPFTLHLSYLSFSLSLSLSMYI